MILKKQPAYKRMPVLSLMKLQIVLTNIYLSTSVNTDDDDLDLR